jgi:hypothetical protein
MKFIILVLSVVAIANAQFHFEVIDNGSVVSLETVEQQQQDRFAQRMRVARSNSDSASSSNSDSASNSNSDETVECNSDKKKCLRECFASQAPIRRPGKQNRKQLEKCMKSCLRCKPTTATTANPATATNAVTSTNAVTATNAVTVTEAVTATFPTTTPITTPAV